MDRDEKLAATFVALSRTLIGNYDVQDFLQQLVDRCSELVDAAAVGVLLVDADGVLRMSAASTTDMEELEAFEIQAEEGPCYDAFTRGEQLVDEDLTREEPRWPRFRHLATRLGYRSVHAFPLQVHDERLGALNVFFAHAGPFPQADLFALQALADIAAVGSAQQHMTSRRHDLHHVAIDDLSRAALEIAPLDVVYERVCSTLRRMFDAPLCQIHELGLTGQLVPRAGTGWDEPLDAALPSPGSPWGHTLTRQGPVWFANLADDERFTEPSLTSHGIVSGMSVVIPGDSRPFGTLSVFTREPRDFDRDDIRALASVATLLGSVIARHAAESQLRQAQKLDAVGRLATGVAHNFNNLLTIMLGNAQLLAMDDEGPELDAIVAAGNQARGLIGRLLTFSRQEPAHMEAVDLNATVTSTVAMLRSVLGPGIVLTTELDDDLPPVQGDASQLGEVVLNLVVNARDAMPDGGDITIRTSRVPDEESGDDSHTIRLVVADTGQGMSKEVLAHAFDPFFTTKPPGQGTGLGLAAVYGAITAIDGHLAVDSAPGRGTTFVIDLPPAASPVAGGPAPRTGPVPMAPPDPAAR